MWEENIDIFNFLLLSEGEYPDVRKGEVVLFDIPSYE
jgi:hypothetical protein